MAEPGMLGLAVDGAPVCVPVRSRSAAVGNFSFGSGVKVFIWLGAAGAEDLLLLPKHIDFSFFAQFADGVAVLGHKPVLIEQPDEALIG